MRSVHPLSGILALLYLTLSTFTAQALPGEPVNMGFESGLDGWTVGGIAPYSGSDEYEVSADAEVAAEGGTSARITFAGEKPSDAFFGSLAQAIDATPWRGKRVRLTGHIRCADARYAQLYLRADNAGGVMTRDTMDGREISGTSDWQEVVCIIDVPEAATQLVLGAMFWGETLWVDGLVLEAVGPEVPLLTEVSVSTAPPTPEQLAWVRGHAVPFETVEAGNGFDDLEAFGEMVGDARIVALGECTHGSREVFQMKHRLVEYLAAEKGFTIFSIEASTPEAYRVGDYVAGGEGDVEALIGGMYFWTWNTESVRDMVEWMRAFNASGEGDIAFTGFDMQTPDVAGEIVAEYFESVDAERAPDVREKNRAFSGSRGGSRFGVVTWTFPIEDARGKTVRFSGSIRTEDVADGWAGLWWRADRGQQRAVAFDNMSGRGATGTSDWSMYVLELDVPDDATNINFGMLMPATGTAWFDDLEVTLDGEPWESDEFDFGFESGDLPGYYSNDDTYRVRVATNVALSGSNSLRMECLQAPSAAGQLEPAEDAAAIVAILDQNRDAYVAASSPEAFAWARHNAVIVHQCMRMRQGRSFMIRDESMAENVAWILDQDPDARIVLWAHNSHVSRDHQWMGDHLARRYGDDYVPVAFTTRSGTYTAWSEKSLGEDALAEPGPATIEAFLAGAGQPLCILDLRGAVPGDPASGWLHEDREMRGIGAMAMDEQFRPVRAAGYWDILIYIEETSAARQLRTAPGRRDG